MRSKWKHSYCDFKTIKRTLRTKNKFIRVYSRGSMILPIFLKKNMLVHNGIIFKKIIIHNYHLFHKFGEFSFSKKMALHFKKSKSKKHTRNK